MKKYSLLLSMLFISAVTFAQGQPKTNDKVPPMEMKKDFSFHPNYNSSKQELEKNLREATIALKSSPDDKNAQGAYIKALRAKMEYKIKMDSIRKDAYKMKDCLASDKKEALQNAKKALSEAVKEMEKNRNSYEKQKAVIAAQKAVFVAEKNASPLFIVDGKECASMDNIERQNIECISVVKNDETIKKYGDKAQNGVVFITTKKDNTTPQQPKTGANNQMNRPENAQRIPMDQMRIEHIVKAANISDKQKDDFTKTYNQYTNEIETLRRNANKISNDKENASLANIESIFKTNITIEQKRIDMYKELSKTLSAEQLIKVYKADLDFARMMMSKYARNNQNQNQNKGQRPAGNDNMHQENAPSQRPQNRGGFQDEAVL